MGKYDLKLGDLDSVIAVLLSVSKLNYDPEKVVEVFKRVSDHEEEVKKLQQAAESTWRIVKELDEKAKSLENVIVENGSLVKEIKAMRDSKLETGDVKAVVDAAVRIGSENGLSARGAITKIVSYLQQSWDANLGLELELQRLN